MIARLRPQLLLDVALAVAAVGFATGIGWEVAHTRPLPSPRAPGARAATVATPTTPGAAARRPAAPTTADTLAARNLFSASRSEVTAVAAVPAGPKPVLHGVLVDGEKSRAFLEDPVAKRVFGYAVGDTVGGGQLEQIGNDYVTIRRPAGVIDVLLKDPAKPKPAAAAATGTALPGPTATPPLPVAPPAKGATTAPRSPGPPGQPPAPQASAAPPTVGPSR